MHATTHMLFNGTMPSPSDGAGTAAMTTPAPIPGDIHTDGRQFRLAGGPSSSAIVGICAALAFEGALTALWFSSFNRWAAWAIGILNAGMIAWFWYSYRPGRKSTLTIRADDIEIVRGQRIQFQFRRPDIAGVELATWRSVQDVVPDYLNTAHPFEPNVLITLDRPIEVRLAMGMSKGVRRIGVRVEDAERVLAALGAPTASVQTRS